MKKILLMFVVLFASLGASAQTWKLVKGIDYSTSTWMGWAGGDGYTREIKDGALVITNPEKKGDNYMLQYHSLDGISIEKDETYKVEVELEADGDGFVFLALCDWGSNGKNGANLNFVAGKQTLSYTIDKSEVTASAFLMTQTGHFVGTYKIYTINVYHAVDEAPVELESVAANLAADVHAVKVYPAGDAGDATPNADGIYVVTAPAKVNQAWDTQFWVKFNTPITNAEVTLSFDCKATKAGSKGTGLHKTPGDWKAGGPANVDFKTDWSTYKQTFKINNAAGIESFGIDLTDDTEEVEYQFKNIQVSVGLLMGDAKMSVTEGDMILVKDWEGISITYPNNNLSLALGASKKDAVLKAYEAYLYEKGVEEPVANANNHTMNLADAIEMFYNEDLNAGTAYSVVIPKFGLRLEVGDKTYWYNEKEIKVNFTAVDKVYSFDEKTANTTTFDLAEASNYDAEAGKFTGKGGWEFAEGVDLSAHKWLIVATTYNASAAGGEFRIADTEGNSFGGEDYNREGSGSRGNMWIDRWNNQICAAVNLEHLAKKGLNLESIQSLTFNANQPVSAVYLTNYEAGKAVADQSGWGSFTGDYVREYARLAEGQYKFGTICLPYAAAVSGAKVYNVSAVGSDYVSLEQVNGVLEAGKAYIYKADDTVGLNGDGASNVNFIRVDANEVAEPATDGMLVGTFEEVDGEVGTYVLQTINDVQQFYKVGASAIHITANHAWLSVASDVKAFYLDQNGVETAIQSVADNATKSIFDLSGRRVNKALKGIYIIDGKKVIK